MPEIIALHCGVTTVLDHFHCANDLDQINAALQACKDSGVRILWCPARQVRCSFIYSNRHINKSKKRVNVPL